MISLNRDILFDIGKKLVEDGDSDAVYKFALSGKEHLQAIKNVLASVTTVVLCADRYVIGWDNPRCAFNFKSNKPHLKFLMCYIGNSVTELGIDCFFTNSHRRIYQPIIYKLVAKRQLISFSLSSDAYCPPTFLDHFLPRFSSTLKHVSILSVCMTPKFRDSFNLDSLTILDAFRDRLPLYCCKTTHLKFTADEPYPFQRFDLFISSNPQLSPALSSVKQVTFNRATGCCYMKYCYGFRETMKYFPSLEVMQFMIPLRRVRDISWYDAVYSLILTEAKKVPLKVVLEFDKKLKSIDQSGTPSLYEFDNSNPNFYCFRKVIPSGGTESTILELQIPK